MISAGPTQRISGFGLPILWTAARTIPALCHWLSLARPRALTAFRHQVAAHPNAPSADIRFAVTLLHSGTADPARIRLLRAAKDHGAVRSRRLAEFCGPAGN